MTGSEQDCEMGGCWLHPHVQVQVSVIQGCGLFAARPLTAGTTIAALAGQLVSGDELARLLADARASQRYLDSICVDEDAHLVLPPGQLIHLWQPQLRPEHVAHRCVHTRNAPRYPRRRRTDRGLRDPDHRGSFRMPCRCGAPACRQVITGTDWQIPPWRDHYQGHVVPAVARRIAAQH